MSLTRVRQSILPLSHFLPLRTTKFVRVAFSTLRSTAELGPFAQFDIRNRIMIVTGGARGLGLEIADQLYDAGAHVYCLDRLQDPDSEFMAAQQRNSQLGGSLLYKCVDITDARMVNDTVHSIAAQHGRIDGLVANAGVTLTLDAIQHTEADVEKIMRCNYWGTFLCATAVGRQILQQKTQGSILLVASMSGLVANKGIFTSVYNSSKAGVIQLARNLAQEWGPINEDGRGGIRVNSLCPGHIATPMAEKTLHENPGAREIWESENMLRRIARPHEFRGAALFLLSDASSYMTGSTLVVDGGHTAW